MENTQPIPAENSVGTNNAETSVPTNASTTVNSSPATNKKGGLKWIFIVLGIILLLGVLCCAGCFGSTYYLDMQSKKGLKEDTSLSNLTFYYPEKYSKQSSESNQLTYQSNDKNSLNGNNNIRTVSDDSLDDVEISTSKECEDAADEVGSLLVDALFLGNDDIRIKDTIHTSVNKDYRCSFTLELEVADKDKNSAKAYNQFKILEKDGKKYGVSAFYDDKASDEEKDQLKRAVEKFSLKN